MIIITKKISLYIYIYLYIMKIMLFYYIQSIIRFRWILNNIISNKTCSEYFKCAGVRLTKFCEIAQKRLTTIYIHDDNMLIN